MPERPWNILVSCNGNSAGSLPAEALRNALGGGRLHARRGADNPAAMEGLAMEDGE
ncbi:MAG TPA: hypothetical protein PKC23_01760 [Candidatus Desulfobacillus sp.]|nr:hypothetical protein [Candidatus Desulfobacillus sp.]